MIISKKITFFWNFIQYFLASSYVRIANSCDGNSINANGPSPLTIGIFIYSSIQISNAGSKKTNVLPYPLGATPIMSLPINLKYNNYYTAGIPYIWIGVGFFIFILDNILRILSSTLKSLNDFIGGGGFSPSIKILYFLSNPFILY